MKMRRKEEEKIEYINLWKKSGVSKSEFCKRMGLSYQTFLRWEKTIAVTSEVLPDRQDIHIVPVKITQDIHETPYIVLCLRACSIKIMPGFPQSNLKQILELLEV